MTAHEGRCNGLGQFRIELPRTTSARQHGLTVTAMAPGFGIGWTDLDPDADPPVADVALRPELIVRGRMFDVKGQPAPGVALRIELMHYVVRGTPTMPVARPDFDELHRRDFPAWPGPAISDDQGRFTLRGLSRDLLCRLLIDDPRFAIPLTTLQTAEKVDARIPFARLGTIKVDPGPDPEPITIALQPAKTIVGRVTYADTGRPVPHALVASGPSYSEADAEGRFRVSTGPAAAGRFGVRAQSADGAPYLMTFKQGEWPKGAIEQSADIALPRGVVVRGKITEEGTGRPVAGAVVRVTSAPSRGGPPPGAGVPAVTGADGTYRVAAPPGPGYLVVQGPDDDYVLREFGGEGDMYVAVAGRRRLYAHAYRAVDLKPGGPDHEVNLSLRRGVALHGRAVGPDGQPVRDAWVCSRLMLRTQADGGWKMFILPQDHSRSPVQGRPLRAARARSQPRGRGPCLLPRSRAQARRNCPVLGPVGSGWSRSPSASSPAARPGAGWSHPTASRSIAMTPERWPRWSSPRGRSRGARRKTVRCSPKKRAWLHSTRSTTAATSSPTPRADSRCPP